MKILFFFLFLLSSSEKDYIKKINELIKRRRYDKAEEIIRENRKKGKNEKLDYLFIYVFYKKKVPDSVIFYSNKFLKDYTRSKFKTEVLYMLAKGYEDKKFSIRAFETYIEVLRQGKSPYYKEAEKKVIKYAKIISLRDLLRNITKLQNMPIYPELLSIGFDKARAEGDLQAQEEIYTILKEFYPEHKKTKEAERIFEKKKKSFLPIFGERRGNLVLLLPLTGPDSTYGRDFLRGFKLSFKENSYKTEDTKGEPLYTYKVLKDLFTFSQNFSIAVGPILEENMFIALPLFSEKKDKVFILPSLSYIRAPEFGNNIISFSNSIHEEIKAIVERFILPNNFDSIAILIPETIEGESIYSFLHDLFSNKENLKVLFLTYSIDSVDFQSRLDSMIKFFGDTLGPELIIFPSGTEEGLLALASQVVFKGFKSLIITTGKFTTEDFALKSNQYIEDKVIFSSIGIWDRTLYEKFIEEYKKAYNDYPGEAAFLGYDTGIILNYAFEKNMSGPFSFKNFLRNLKVFKGAYKFYLFAEEGDFIVKFYRIKNKRFYEIK